MPDDVFGIAEYQGTVIGPGALNGVQTCWLRPTGNFFLLEFEDDVGTDLGWDLNFLPLPVTLGEQSYRGSNPFFVGTYEEEMGTDLGIAPFIVRFQGARAIKLIENLCDVELAGTESHIFPGSLTGWVKHPAELNSFFGDPALRPNMIRFQILFDTASPLFSTVAGITSLTISVLPD